MALELDHIFVRAAPGAPEADALGAFGLLEVSGNRHPGQGTANRRFFFQNAFIELLWIDDAAQASSGATRRTMLRERLGDLSDDLSPFGICFRPEAGEPAPFATWDYEPAYLPPGMAIGIAADAPLREPMWFFFERGSAPRSQPLEHAHGIRAITSVSVTVPGMHGLSDAARVAVGTGRVALIAGERHLLDIEFDHGGTGRRHDSRPALPLIIRY